MLEIDSSLACPRCAGTPLAKLEDATGLEVDCCPTCRGIWCQRGELERLLGEHRDRSFLPLPFASGNGSGPVCPECFHGGLDSRCAAGDPSLELLDCLGCGGTWLDGGLLPRLRKRLIDRRVERPAPQSALPQPAMSPREVKPHLTVDDQIPFDSPWILRLALPSAFLFGLVCLWPTLLALVLFPVVFFHELGHAVVAWLGGWFALPLPWGLTLVDRWSWFVVLGVTTVLGVLGWRGVHERKPFLMVFAGGMLLLQLILTFVVSRDQAAMWLSYGGIAGEFLLSTLAIVAFYHPGPQRLRWDFWRFPLLVAGAIVYVHSTALWIGVQKDPSRMPFGAAYGRESDGDLNRLVDQWGWTPDEILASFLTLALLCGWAILGHYVFFLARSFRQRPAADP